MITSEKQPCDEAVIQTGHVTVACEQRNKPWVLAATILGSSIAFINGSVVNVALPAIQTALSATVADMQWVINSYALILGALILTGGSSGDHYGRKKIFNWGILIFMAASIWCGLAPNVDHLITARALQGIGGALLIPNSLAIISATFYEKERGKAIGTWSGFSALTTAIGPVLGGWLVDEFSWRPVFFVSVPLALATLVISVWKIPENRDVSRTGGLDWWGALLATTGLGGLCFGFIKASDLGFNSPPVMISIMGGGLLLGLFLWVEFRKSNPMMPPRLFKSATFSGANLLTLFLYFALSGVFFFLPFNLIQVQGYSATTAGAAFLPFTLIMGLLSRWSGGLIERYGPKLPLVIGPAITAVGFLMLAIPGQGGPYWLTFFPGMTVIGFGMAISVAPLTTTVLSAVNTEDTGSASGINNAISRVSGMLAVAVLGVVAIFIFGDQLSMLMKNAGISAGVQSDLLAQISRLAETEIPSEVPTIIQQQLSEFVDKAFISSFRIVMFLSAGLAFLGALFSWWMIEEEITAD